ncbi:MAG: alcohol dehydrogenase [Chloroflexi bacterium]|nr:alcohol dehydrogenase [Chloroflexota bacterium]|tara:strand:- start:3157 stop:4440 length:1284 start_codon:yes stop_codon:yes gene_type:complete
MTSVNFEKIFAMENSSIKFGRGSTQDVGFEAKRLGINKVLILTDKNISELPVTQNVIKSLEAEDIDFKIYSDIKIEPTDSSFKDASKIANSDSFDGFIAIGGGSTIDTAKAANLYSTYQGDFLDYVNAPIGKGKRIPGPLKPLIAIPTTSGTGSETSGGAIFDLEEMNAKTGLSDRYLRPSIGIVDPINVMTMPSMVTACSGFDVLCHGLESYTALPFSEREYSGDPFTRPAYQGSNPISDIFALKAIELVSKNIEKAISFPDEILYKENMLLASTLAGVGFGNAGVHLPHGMSYAVSGYVKEYLPEGYPDVKPIIPHGLSVIINAPAVFKFTFESNPDRHLIAASIMDSDDLSSDEKSIDLLSSKIINLLKNLNMPNGLQALGYNDDDIPKLVDATLPQHRVTKLSPVKVGKNELERLFSDSMSLW